MEANVTSAITHSTCTMWHDLTAASFGTHLVLYDPAAIPDDFPFDADTETPEPAPPSPEALRQLATAGKALVLEIAAGDCEATIRVLVDEPLPNTHGGPQKPSVLESRLEVPSGVLTAAGAEFIHPVPNARRFSDCAVVKVPAGNYHIQVVDRYARKEAPRDAYVESKTTITNRRISKAVDYFTFSWIALFVSTILIVPGITLLIWINLGYIAALIGIGSLVAIHVAYLLAFGILGWATSHWPGIDQPSFARSEFDRDNPDVLVALHRAPMQSQEADAAYMLIRAIP